MPARIWKKFWPATSNGLNINSEMPWSRGDRFQANIRGNGFLFEGPGASKFEDDPFGLNQNKST